MAMRFLLDVNVLIALIDDRHIHHEPAHRWFGSVGRKEWATCPFTQNAVLRILSGPGYSNAFGTPAVISEILAPLCALPGHVFWPDDLSLLSCAEVELSRLLHSAQISDTYLLALASTHEGQLATFDRRLVVSAVRNGKSALHLIN
jgi:toxin-antitoxin system PIN domain toxin